jgi:serine protease Do
VKEPLPAMELADSDNIEVGDMVLAIGNPFGVGQTVTSGIVSALGRSTPEISGYGSFIQTDAAINPGNSGGPLITSDGRLIGINTAIYSQSGGSIGIGFAIPSNMARNVIASILKQGKVVHGWFGAAGKTVTADLAKNLGLPRPQGVVITRVSVGSPAARAGLKSGDVVRKINGHVADGVEGLQYLLATLPVGTTATLDVSRDGAEQTLRMPVEGPPEVPARTPTVLQGRQPLAGVTVANLNPALADELGLQYQEPEVIITKIDGNSYAARVGAQPGDIILSVNQSDVKSVQELVEVMKQPVQSWTITLNRGGQTLQFTVSI